MSNLTSSSSVEAWFEEGLFQPRYQRNNKRGGLKNLRCFPTCAAQHKERGFCGRPVLVNVKTNIPTERLICFVEFLKSDDPKPLAIGERITIKKAEEISRTKDEPLKPWIKGVLSQGNQGVSSFEFNREKRGWHYGWASNKHTCNASHVLVAWIFEYDLVDQDMISLRCIAESPPFMLFCRRRRRFTLVPSAPIAEPKKSKMNSSSNVLYDDDEDDDDDDEDIEEEEESPPSKRKVAASAAKKKNIAPTTKKSPVPSSSSSSSSSSQRKRTKTSNLPDDMMDAFTLSKTGSDIVLDKNRTEALLSLLHMTWRKMKTENFGGGKGGESTPTTATDSSAPSNDTEFFDMLDFLSGTLDFDDALDIGGNLEDPLPTSSSSAAQATEDDDVDEVDPDTEALAKYLLEQSDFRQSVLWLRGQGAHPDFSAFLGILRDHIQMYMKFRFWTITDIDRLIENSFENGSPENITIKTEPSAPWLVGGEDFSWGSVSTNPSSPREFQVDSFSIPNITGIWKQTRESQIEMEQAREKNGSSWVMSKLFEFMESKFSIQQHGLEMSCRLWPLPSLKFVLDGELHPWGISLPLFQPNWKYRAWTDGRFITLQHEIENRRLTRRYWCDPGRRYLYSEAFLEVKDTFTDTFVQESKGNANR